MKTKSIFIFTILSLVFCSLTLPKSNILNTNSWSISIGKKLILASYKNNKMGDIAKLDKKNLKISDTLFAQRYLCGSSGISSITTLTLKNSHNEIIKETKNKENLWIFTARMPLKDVLNSPKIKANEVVDIYFTISDITENKNNTVLLGKLILN